jgi:hypothetical protein
MGSGRDDFVILSGILFVLLYLSNKDYRPFLDLCTSTKREGLNHFME